MAEPDRNPATDAQPAAGESQPDPAPADAAGAAVESSELEQARAEARDHYSRLLRLQADFDNYRKRARREQEETIQYANLALVRDFLPVLDNLERALGAAESATVESLRSGLELIVRQFREALERAGVTPVPGVNEPFDPNMHEAVQQAEGDYDVPTVVEEYQKGYRMGDRLVRPSMVKVAGR